MRIFQFVILILLLVTTAEAKTTGVVSTPADVSSASVDREPVVPASREGGETVVDAIPIWELPFIDTGNTDNNIDDYDEVCPYTGSNSPDVVYVTYPQANCIIDIVLCDSAYDTKLYVYENAVTPGAPYACNDDADCSLQYRSALWHMSVTGGNAYYIVVDGYGGEVGEYTIDVRMPNPGAPPYIIPCPDGSLIEDEPLYYSYIDNYNGGCASDPFVAQHLEYNTSFCGTTGAYWSNGTLVIDSDWFTITADEDMYSNWTVHGKIVDLSVVTADCNNLETLYSLSVYYEEVVIEFPHPAGTELWLIISYSEDYSIPYPWEENYVMSLSESTQPPSAVSGVSWGEIKSKFK